MTFQQHFSLACYQLKINCFYCKTLCILFIHLLVTFLFLQLIMLAIKIAYIQLLHYKQISLFMKRTHLVYYQVTCSVSFPLPCMPGEKTYVVYYWGCICIVLITCQDLNTSTNYDFFIAHKPGFWTTCWTVHNVCLKINHICSYCKYNPLCLWFLSRHIDA